MPGFRDLRMKTIYTTLAILLVAAIATAQTTTTGSLAAGTERFTFKGTPLGMTLERFKVANSTTPCFTKNDVDAPLQYQTALAQARLKEATDQNNVLVLQSQFPYIKGKAAKVAASNAIRRAIQDAQNASAAVQSLQLHVPKSVPRTVHFVKLTADEIACSSGDANQDALIVGSFHVSGVVYTFLDSKLFKVTILFPSGLVTPLREAFTTKYGPSTVLANDEYQNGFGARWSGANFAWTNGTQAILLHQGASNGPGQEHDARSGSLTYEDHSLEQVPVKAATNF
jgi:hypothetical protein